MICYKPSVPITALPQHAWHAHSCRQMNVAECALLCASAVQAKAQESLETHDSFLLAAQQMQMPQANTVSPGQEAC